MAHNQILQAYVIVLVYILWGCTSDTSISPRDSSENPYVLEPIRTHSGEYQPVDLDGDGRDEIVREHALFTASKYGRAIQVKTLEDQIIDQVNFDGTFQEKLYITDWDDDEKSEILVSVLRNDSLFIQVLNASLTNRKITRGPDFFLTTGIGRNREGQVHSWDPYISSLYNTNTGAKSNDSQLITTIVTGYAGMPRGLFKHSISTGELVDSLLIGSPPYIVAIDDVDEDSEQEIILTTQATDNDISANGYSDDYSFLIVVDLNSFDIEWVEKIGYRIAYPTLVQADLDGNGVNEYVLMISTNDASETGRTLSLIDFNRRKIKDISKFESSIEGFAVANLLQDNTDEIMVLDRKGVLYIIDGLQYSVRKMKLDVELKSPYLVTIPDVDGDGIEEIIIHTIEGDLFLNPDLTLKAYYPYSMYKSVKTSPKWGVVEAGIDTGRLLYFVFGGETTMYRLAKNRMYLWNRYGNWIGWSLGSIVLLFALSVATRYRAIEQRLDKQTASQKDSTILKEELAACLVRPVVTSDLPVSLFQVHLLLTNHASDDAFTVKDLAAKFGASERNFRRQLIQLTGMRPAELLWKYRIHRIAEQLQNVSSSATISEIAYGNGFKDSGHMTKLFKKEFDQTPTEYRNSFR